MSSDEEYIRWRALVATFSGYAGSWYIHEKKLREIGG